MKFTVACVTFTVFCPMFHEAAIVVINAFVVEAGPIEFGTFGWCGSTCGRDGHVGSFDCICCYTSSRCSRCFCMDAWFGHCWMILLMQQVVVGGGEMFFLGLAGSTCVVQLIQILSL